MVCFIVPLIATIIGFTGRKVFNKKGSHGFWLNIMLLGGAVFGGIDHLWNGELFIIGTNWLMDLALGGAITGGIVASWGIISFKDKINISKMFGISTELKVLQNAHSKNS
ncbi:MAG: hypothetical protein ABIJ92_01660 [Candidatus Aenigmatarchaeota archaeon]